ncbi:F-box/LRR-repeat protein 14-like [Phragmites australis]|uniref:F-box/LRR-repeat protein 14-like n=1 Tax=Phragmites australis TaxID=29695 RepID=UPI002D783EA5|nr:F-box/LRR-repeat protein 14-like [Phragmites australis]XP_062221677.1 F-box/LRR-repeat protein 14-like [Phragmites australis]XP_062221678.1 F-box/LRR-repeat protein 14-like [Phragmites australis]XP_062221679.1 F-box/LRR-repeat protein 14-like [Phragmites australis]XP_062221680.1 F-box/LRR-repeat protein 14-like [Phragmites australis]XP_062221681.1 F-box/LRR-repeat protein 14-like [Phragmites australis]XP_062221683.1 F-box/LRR-repeat protein 14-like [Phragmites australis]XP_062221684.1 F-b
MEDLPEPLLAEIIKRINRTSDLNSLSLVSKRLYTVEAEERGTVHVGCGLHPATEALSTLCSRFPNLWKIEINYSGWTSDRGKQLDNQGLRVLSSHCPSLVDLTLSFCSYINDSGLSYLAYSKKLMALRLNFTPAISSSGLLSVVVGCKSLSTFHLIDCMKVGSMEWLEYLGRVGSLEELVVKDCKGISQYDLLKFGPGWMKLQKFEFEINGNYWVTGASDPSYDAHYPYKYDICCDYLKDLRLAHIITEPEIGLRFLLGKCKALEKLCLDYVIGLNESEMISLFQSCSNLRSISLRLMPLRCGFSFRTPLTDDSLKALSLSCPMLQVVELTFTFCDAAYPSEIGFTQKGIVMLVQSCPIRVLMLNGANNFNDEGMKNLSSAQFLETLELVDCKRITDAGMSFIMCAPCLSRLTLRKCNKVTDDGMAELVRSQKLESLTVIGCRRISLKVVQGAARSVHYSAEPEGFDRLKGMKKMEVSTLFSQIFP